MSRDTSRLRLDDAGPVSKAVEKRASQVIVPWIHIGAIDFFLAACNVRKKNMGDVHSHGGIQKSLVYNGKSQLEMVEFGRSRAILCISLLCIFGHRHGRIDGLIDGWL